MFSRRGALRGEHFHPALRGKVRVRAQADAEEERRVRRRIVGCQFLLIQGSAIIFSMAEPTYWKKFWESFGTRLILTVLVIALLLSPRRCEVWALLSTGPLNELGDFLAGVFTPAALGWLVYGYFLQKTELGLQRQELQQTRETLGKQVEVLQEQSDAERQRSSPYLFLREERRNNRRRTFSVRNSRAPAHDLEVTCCEDGGPEVKRPYEGVLDKDKEHEFDIFDAPTYTTNSHTSFITACFISERDERLYQRWEITRDLGRRSAEIQQITRGPQLLKEGESPPLPN